MKLFVSPFPSSSGISSIVSYNFSTSSSSYYDVGMYTCIIRILSGSAFKLIAIIIIIIIKVIYKYVPETKNISTAHNFAALMYLKSVVLKILFST
jgi:CBS domain containing-hemolysin-like protein